MGSTEPQLARSSGEPPPTGGAQPRGEPPPTGGAKELSRWAQLAIGLTGVAIGIGVVLAVPELRHALSLALHGNLDGLRHEFRALGASGAALLLGLMLAHALIFYPTELVTATAGIAYGFLPGLALVTVGWLLSGLLSYAIGVIAGRPLLSLVVGYERFAALERTVARGGAPLLLGLRLVPVLPFSLTGYVAGAVRVPLWRFAWTTVVGYLPLTAIVTYLGSQSNSLPLTDPRLWGGLALILLLLLAARGLRSRLASDATNRPPSSGSPPERSGS
jgi:uncharacterized membrane protein YdjX (TVP38/TMEM64 family)